MSDPVAASAAASLGPAGQPAAPMQSTSQATSVNTLPRSGGASADGPISSPLPVDANPRISSTVPKTAVRAVSVPALVALLNKYHNDTGRPSQFRVDPGSRGQTIQEINPSNGAIIGDFAVTEFPALARGLGIAGVWVDSHA